MIELLRKQLDCFNDVEFKFDPKQHKYTYLDETFISVTRFIQQFHKPFDQDYWSKKKADESGVPQEWVINEWKKINDYANEVGTDTHQWIEDYFNQIWKPLPTNQDVIHRINKFNKIYAKQLYKLDPLKFEVRVFSKKWKIAGMIDSLFLYRGKIYILDWKTNKNLIKSLKPWKVKMKSLPRAYFSMGKYSTPMNWLPVSSARQRKVLY